MSEPFNGWCYMCGNFLECTIDEDGDKVCTDCAFLNKLKAASRKRPPTEKPQDGEVVLAISKMGNLVVEEFHDPWFLEDQLDGWWPIKHLIEGN